MFALMSDGKGRLGGFVLPRWLRKPVRVLQRVQIEAIEPPPFAATMASAALFALAGLYGGIQGGHTETVVKAVTSRLGFALANIEISGNQQTSEIDVLQQIELDGSTSTVGFNVREARERLAELPWVQSVAVQKVYPDTLAVTMVEKEPFALWQQGSQVSVIQHSGEIIAPFAGGRLASLPLVIGMGANETGPEIIDRVQRVRGLQGRVRAYIRVADRRWDLRLDNGLTIKLPETGIDAALSEVSRLDAEYALFSRDIVTIDLRLPDRLTVALAPEAAEARQKAFEEMQKQRKKETRI